MLRAPASAASAVRTGVASRASVKRGGVISRAATSASEPSQPQQASMSASERAEIVRSDWPSSVRSVLLSDRECPLCEREVTFLERRDASRNGENAPRLGIVDISKPGEPERFGIPWETAMKSIHAVDSDGSVNEGIDALRRAYEEVGLGWVYAAARFKPMKAILDLLYNFWASLRLPITGRGSLEQVKQSVEDVNESEGGSCRIDGSGCD